jgi:uncharacterized protein YecE (DUF72 family)
MRQLRIGISGWTYEPWRKAFFPVGLAQKQELFFASRQLRSIEINGTFYSLQTPKSFGAWADATPDDFIFSVKAPRFITHIRRLKDVAGPLANFWASGVLRLGPKLGPILWQLPPSFRFDAERLEAFFEQLPRDHRAAAAQAKQHDDHLRGTAWTEVKQNRPLQHTLEVRHASFETPAFLALLRKHQIGVVVADTAGKWPQIETATSDLVYIRLHGAQELYVSGYTPAALKAWAKKITAWHRTKDVYVYFDNDVKVHAPFDAMTLAHLLGTGPAAPAFPQGTPEDVNPSKARKTPPGYRRSPKISRAARSPEAKAPWTVPSSKGSAVASPAKNSVPPTGRPKRRGASSSPATE